MTRSDTEETERSLRNPDGFRAEEAEVALCIDDRAIARTIAPVLKTPGCAR